MASDGLRGLAGLGWEVDAAPDVCWLDHAAAPAYRKVWTDRYGRRWEIYLCPGDALVLEQGAWNGDYDGAPTPGASMAGEWPWLPLAEAG